MSTTPMPLPALTLRSVRTIAVEVPLRYVLGTSAATVRAAPLVLVDVETGQGVVGRSYVFCYRFSGARAMALESSRPGGKRHGCHAGQLPRNSCFCGVIDPNSTTTLNAPGAAAERNLALGS